MGRAQPASQHAPTDPRYADDDSTTRRSTVAEAMLPSPKIMRTDFTVGQARAAFADDHMHAVLIVAEGLLRAVIYREDVHKPAPAEQLAWRLGSLCGRIVSPEDDLEAVRTRMLDAGVRRLAVVDEGLCLLGLLCLKRSHRGFCSASDVAARAHSTA